jgi:hypothetical protein
MTNIMDKKKFIAWAEKRLESFDNRITKDFGGGLIDDLGKYNELKMIKETAERGEFDAVVWGD